MAMYYKAFIISGGIILGNNQHNDPALHAYIDVTVVVHEIIKALILQFHNRPCQLRCLTLCQLINDFSIFIENKACCFIKHDRHPLITISIANSDLIEK